MKWDLSLTPVPTVSVVHLLDEVGDPPHAGFHEDDPQVREPLEDAGEDELPDGRVHGREDAGQATDGFGVRVGSLAQN